jgi:uncharacterized membrane protein
MVYWSVDNLIRKNPMGRPVMSHIGGVAIALVLIGVAFFVYEAVYRTLARKNERVAVGVLFGLFVVMAALLAQVFTGRALFVHAGMFLGTVMIMNVWMRIWPAQKKLIQAAKGVAPAPDPSVAPDAAMRSKHNTYLSVPLVFTMVSNHYPTIYGWEHSWIVLCGIAALGFLVAKLLYVKSAGPAPALYGAPAQLPPTGRPGMASPKP